MYYLDHAFICTEISLKNVFSKFHPFNHFYAAASLPGSLKLKKMIWTRSMMRYSLLFCQVPTP